MAYVDRLAIAFRKLRHVELRLSTVNLFVAGLRPDKQRAALVDLALACPGDDAPAASSRQHTPDKITRPVDGQQLMERATFQADRCSPSGPRQH